MNTRAFFPTLVYQSRLRPTRWRALNDQQLRECQQLREDDGAGRRRSVKSYPGGYTSYNSVSRMQRVSPTFAALERQLARHVKAFARRLEFDLTGRALEMTDCWVINMPRTVVQGLHLHPLSPISGANYV